MKKTAVKLELRKLSSREFEINRRKVYAYDKVGVFDENAIGVAGAKYQIVSFPPGASVAPHFHKKVREVFFIGSGKGIVEINGTAYNAVTGDVFLIQPHDVHALKNAGRLPFILHIFKWNEDPDDITWK